MYGRVEQLLPEVVYLPLLPLLCAHQLHPSASKGAASDEHIVANFNA